MKNQLIFYAESGAAFVVVHKYLANGQMLRCVCGHGEHGLNLEICEGHGVNDIREELNEQVHSIDFSEWTVFENEEEEMELTHFETCMGPVERAYAFIIEW